MSNKKKQPKSKSNFVNTHNSNQKQSMYNGLPKNDASSSAYFEKEPII